ncbi:interferon gamma 1 [Trichomycterus rosablanca]|uniref:interferon gamma 1 n=1 Tax=Trichomycterus rosablanca TaxID=2290929 RepID=UPI002F3610E5
MMTLYLGICLLVFGWTANSEASLPKNFEKSINELNGHYQSKNTDKLFTGPIFVGKLRNLHEKFEEGEQKLLMTIILDAYDRIFARMENETQDDKVKMNLREVTDQLNKLKEHYFSGKHSDLKSYVNDLLALKESDPLIQRKALFELKSVYKTAAKMGDLSAQTSRRRRQAKVSKKHSARLTKK